jgi:class 3 adenylate cyclase/tetratricopeptide (TPR) repeat protein
MHTGSSLATVLFTDIVGSTERAAELRDRAWGELRLKHHARVRRELRRFGGREVNTAGDGFLASFERPARAILCACAIREGVRELGLEIRSGLHMGELERSGRDLGGLAVHIGARVAAEAGPGEILVSSTVRDALAGSPFDFAERGLHALKGVPGEWRLFAVTSTPAGAGELLEDRRLPRLTRRRAVLGGAAALALLLGLAGVILLRDRMRGPVREAAPAGPAPGLAVMPFTVAGPDLELWREGMVTLLSTNLDGVAGLRAIDPRTVLSRWQREIGEGRDAADRQAALQVARRVGSKYALLGSMVGSAGAVRLTAELYDVATGAPLGTKQVEGPPDSLLALVDRLSVEVLRANVAGEALKLGELDPRRITTASLAAVRAYLEGEQQFRRSRFKEAAAAYTRAIEADSTFAFAYYRLAVGCSWENVGCDLTVDYTGQAIRYADRLPARDALLFEGWAEWSRFGNEQSTVRGIEIFTEFTDRYPDDVEGWYQLGDAFYHRLAPGWPYIPPERTLQVLRRAVELDPGFGPAYVHLFQDAMAREDTVESRRLLAGLRQIDSTSAQAIGSTLAFAMRLGNPAERMQATAALDTLGTEELRWAIGWPLGALGPTSPAHWEEDLRVAELLTQPRHSPEEDQRRVAQYAIAQIYESRGRRHEAAEMLAPILGDLGSFWNYGLVASDLIDYRGTTDSVTAQAAERLTREPSADDRFVVGALAAREQRWSDVERELRALEADVQAASPPDSNIGARAQALRGYAAAVRGERRAAIRAFEEAYRWVTGPTAGLVRVLLGKLWLEEGDFAQAERYFKTMELGDAKVWQVPIEFYLGQVYEGLGDEHEARLHYARFVSWWEDCDPELRPMWEEGRAALQRLTAVPKL